MSMSFAGYVGLAGGGGQTYERVGVTVCQLGWAPVVDSFFVIPLKVGEVVTLPIWVFSETDHTLDTKLKFNYTVTVAAFWEERSVQGDETNVSYFVETATGHTIDVTDYVNYESRQAQKRGQ